jgi:polysaccharide biosynthesis PFTS motif protein
LEKNKRLRILRSDVDLYSLVSSSDLTLGMPYTSPVLIAKEMGKKHFFIALNIESNMPDRHNGIQILKTRESLYKALREALKLK